MRTDCSAGHPQVSFGPRAADLLMAVLEEVDYTGLVRWTRYGEEELTIKGDPEPWQ
jgi:hypothetical protein